MLRSLAILVVAEFAVLGFGAALAPSFAAAANSDGVTVMTAPAPTAPATAAAPSAPNTMEIQVGDGDTIQALAGSTIIVQEDPKTGDYHSEIAAPQ